ncbi:Alpha-galactosidase alpha-n-acetylgalactosaminidase [Penicillium verhagenii]|nr:Alpha-galactosidase alpha-n-acetylgalactosaminidase [Penicillium verhagenii]
MGWNSWNTFKTNFNQSVIENTASLLVSTGLRDVGYNYLIMDEGIYDCGFYPGSWGYEELDAATYAEWGVDYLKYDNCGGFEANTESPQVRFGVMRDALRGTEISQSYRMSGDITDVFSDTGKDCACKTAYCMDVGYARCSVLTIIRKMRELSPFQKPGPWADMDMLEIGNGNMTLHEQQTHMTFWAALKSPLIIGADIQTLSDESLRVLKNKEIIAISQDSLGEAAQYLPALSTEKSIQVWAGPLTGGKVLILVLGELANATTVNISLGYVPGLTSDRTYTVRDIWGARSLGRAKGNISLLVDTHQTRTLVLS